MGRRAAARRAACRSGRGRGAGELLNLSPADEGAYRPRDVASWDTWGGDLALDVFVRQEALLRETAWPRACRIGWIWSDGSGPLASCETYEVPCILAGQTGRAWSVASVYTAPALRGRRHASAMLEALAEHLGGLPDARAIILFSDVDPQIYRRLGYVGRPAWDRVWTVASGPLAARPRIEDRFRIDAPAAQLAWHIERRRVHAKLTGRAPIPSFGTADVSWVDDPATGRLVVLDVTGDPGAAAASAAQAAAAAGLREVRAWETPEWPQALGVRVPRPGALPMLRPLDRGVDPQDWTRIPRAVWV